ncbi:MAG: Bax inhibitor-1 family protein [Cyanobacteria bacterium]|nr:Bax inhibitor-1 family protein [Cyanobacteriota bacterium]
MSNSSVTATSQGGLFAKVSLLLTCSMGMAALGTFLGSGITSGVLMVGLIVLYFVGAFGVRIAARTSKELAIVVLAAWTFVTGLMMGPVIASYAAVIGWQTVFLAFIGTGGIMAGCGAIGALSGRDFSNMGKYLFAGLLIMIVIGLVNIFVAFSTGIEVLYSIAGIALFSLFFIFDFFRLSKADNNWTNAIDLTVDIFLDFIIVFEYILRLIAALVRKDD